MTDGFKDEIRSRMGTSPADIVVDRLNEWGVRRLSSVETNDVTTIDFQTPLPGNQPIRSSLSISGEGVTEATIRYGTLGPNTFDTYPTDPQHPAMRRLKRVVEDVPYDGSLPISVDFGDAGRSPRPHLRTTVSRGGNVAERAATPARVHSGAGERGKPADPVSFTDYIIRVGKAIETAYDDEFQTPVPGMANPPAFVVDFVEIIDDRWDIESAAPTSATETEVILESWGRSGRVVFNPRGEVVRMSTEFQPNPLAGVPSISEWEQSVSAAGWPDATQTWVEEQSGKQTAEWDDARNDETLSAQEAASAFRSLALRV